MGNEFLFLFGVVTVFIEKASAKRWNSIEKRKRILKRILKTNKETLKKKKLNEH